LVARTVALTLALTLAATASVFFALLFLFAAFGTILLLLFTLGALSLAVSVSTAATTATTAAFGFSHDRCKGKSSYEYYELLHLHFGSPVGLFPDFYRQYTPPDRFVTLGRKLFESRANTEGFLDRLWFYVEFYGALERSGAKHNFQRK